MCQDLDKIEKLVIREKGKYYSNFKIKRDIYVEENSMEKITKYLSGDFTELKGLKKIFIYAPNGVGKTTLFEKLKSGDNDYHFVTLDTSAFDIKKSDKELVVSYNAGQIYSISEKISEIKSNASNNYKKVLKGIAVGEQPENIKAYKNGNFEVVDDLPESVDTMLTNADLVKIQNIVSTTTVNKNSFNEEEFKMTEEQLYLKGQLLNVLKNNDFSNSKCPLCNSDFAGMEKFENELEEKLQTKNKIAQKIILEIGVDISGEEKLMSAIKSTVEEGKKDYIEKFNIAALGLTTKKEMEDLAANEKVLEKLKKQKKSAFNKMKNDFSNFENMLELISSDLKIELDEENYNFIIKSIENRNLMSYSSGELNTIKIIFEILKFQASELETVIFDDPFDSFDFKNIYNLIYEIGVVAKINNIVVLTHRYDIATHFKSLGQSDEDFFALDILKQGEITVLKDNLTKDEFRELPYVKANVLRYEEELHELFHGRDLFEYEQCGKTLSNNELLLKFENEDFNYDNTMEMVEAKINFIYGLRVYIERILLYLMSDSQCKKFERLEPTEQTLENLSEIYYPRKRASELSPENKRLRILIKSLKLLANEIAHGRNEIAQYAYPISVRVIDLIKIREQIGAAFENVKNEKTGDRK